jgi:hypothetical protein
MEVGAARSLQHEVDEGREMNELRVPYSRIGTTGASSAETGMALILQAARCDRHFQIPAPLVDQG